MLLINDFPILYILEKLTFHWLVFAFVCQFVGRLVDCITIRSTCLNFFGNELFSPCYPCQSFAFTLLYSRFRLFDFYIAIRSRHKDHFFQIIFNVKRRFWLNFKTRISFAFAAFSFQLFFVKHFKVKFCKMYQQTILYFNLLLKKGARIIMRYSHHQECWLNAMLCYIRKNALSVGFQCYFVFCIARLRRRPPKIFRSIHTLRIFFAMCVCFYSLSFSHSPILHLKRTK